MLLFLFLSQLSCSLSYITLVDHRQSIWSTDCFIPVRSLIGSVWVFETKESKHETQLEEIMPFKLCISEAACFQWLD